MAGHADAVDFARDDDATSATTYMMILFISLFRALPLSFRSAFSADVVSFLTQLAITGFLRLPVALSPTLPRSRRRTIAVAERAVMPLIL